MTRLPVALAALLALLVWHGDARAQQPAPGDPARGKAVAASLCRNCHLIAQDDPGPVPDGVPSFMAMAAKPDASSEGLEARLLGTHPIMPSPPLTRQQAIDVVAYILSLGP